MTIEKSNICPFRIDIPEMPRTELYFSGIDVEEGYPGNPEYREVGNYPPWIKCDITKNICIGESICPIIKKHTCGK